MAEAEQKAGDDSMEQILHSIRDIIAEKTDAPQAPAAADDEVLELTQVVAPAPAEPAPAPAPAAPEGDVLSTIDAALGTPELAPAAPAPAPAPAAKAPALEPAAPAPEPAAASAAPASAEKKAHLVSDDSAQKTTAAIKELMSNIPKPKVESAGFRTGSTVEDLVVESLKPMLSKWLDANLPVIVRELVQKEIEKLVPHERRD